MTVQGIKKFVEFLIAFSDMFELPDFNALDFLKKVGVLQEEAAHFDKSIHYPDTYLHGPMAVQDR